MKRVDDFQQKLAHMVYDAQDESQLGPMALNTYTMECTVPSGLESVAAEECSHTLNVDRGCILTDRGRIYVQVDKQLLPKVFKLRAVDNIRILIGFKYPVSLLGPKEEALKTVETLFNVALWNHGLSAWSSTNKFQGILFPSKEQYEQYMKQNTEGNSAQNVTTASAVSEGEKQNESTGVDDDKTNKVESNDVKVATGDKMKVESDQCSRLEEIQCGIEIPKFRVTCSRVGKHKFSSMEAACAFGGTVQDNHNWKVDLSNHDLEVMLSIIDDSAFIAIALTDESLHKRNITHFGPTTLRATLCYGLVHLAQPKCGDVIVDGLCGGASVSIEGALAYPNTFHLAGDNHPKAVERAKENLADLITSGSRPIPSVDIFSWDATRLPLKDDSVDVFVTDLPFGKRVGHRKDNPALYLNVLTEVGRVVCRKTGRAVFLTHDKKNFFQCLKSTKRLWSLSRSSTVNIGGLTAMIYLLARI